MTSFTAGQVVNYGQVVYVEEKDSWHELNPLVDSVYDNYGRSGLIMYKTASTGILYYAAHKLPKYRTTILTIANVIVWGFVAHDMYVGVGWRW
jgi:hypothetical protein